MTDTERYGDRLFGKDHRDEAARLADIGHLYDAASTARLVALGVGPGWRCLDIGTGAGSMAGWLAGRVAGGEVIALDRDVRAVDPAVAARPEVRVVRGDITDPEPRLGRFDLIHARFVFMHVRERVEVIGRLVADWLAPGGWLVLSDTADPTTQGSANPDYRTAFAATWAVSRQAMGTEIDWVRGCPELLRQAGLVEIGMELHVPPWLPGSPAARFWSHTIALLRDRMVAEGVLGAEVADRAVAAVRDPDLVELAPGMLTSWGRKPR